MKKITNINLAQRVFAIDEDAYTALALYLKEIEARFEADEDQREIINDIEIAVAEKFLVLGRSDAFAVSLPDVQLVIKEMGTAEEVSGDGVYGDSAPAPTLRQRKLYRDNEDRVIAGVAAGVAHYFGINPTWVRLTFLLAVFLDGLGFWVYLILWLFVPKAKTTAERFAMRGSKVTLEELRAYAKNGVSYLKDKVPAQPTIDSWEAALVKFYALIGGLFRSAVKVFKYVVGLFLFLGGLCVTVGLVSLYIIFWFSEQIWIYAKLNLDQQYLFSTTVGLLLFFASFLVLLLPAVGSLLLGARLITKKRIVFTPKISLVVVVWLIALIATITAGALFMEKNRVVTWTLKERHESQPEFYRYHKGFDNQPAVNFRDF